MRVLNAHTAAIDGIAPGAEGDLDVTPGVQHLVSAGLLVPVLEGREADEVMRGAEGPSGDMARMRAYLAAAEEHIAKLGLELRAQRDREGELAAALEAAEAKAAALEADLAVATAPAKKTSKPADATEA